MADTAGTVFPPGMPIIVSSQFTAAGPRLPFAFQGVATGECVLQTYLSDSFSPLFLYFDFFFGPIPAGESRSCTSDIYFDGSARTDMSLDWEVSVLGDNDTRRDNDTIEYVFRVRPVAIPVLSRMMLVVLALALLAIGIALVPKMRHPR
jgi:hypothetical protein